MIYLCEREIGYDPKRIGFPSIRGCRAVVVLTAKGMFGIHLNGSLNDGKKNKFAQFIATHPKGGTGTALYAATTDARSTFYVNELREIAAAVGHTGDIYWSDLSIFDAGSAYVEARIVPSNNTCIITARAWDDADGSEDNRGDYVDGAARTMANGSSPSKMVTNVDPSGMRAFYPTKV